MKVKAPATAVTAPGIGRPEGVDMANSSAIYAFGTDSGTLVDRPSRCRWRGCRNDALEGIPVCFIHGIEVAEVINGYVPVKIATMLEPPSARADDQEPPEPPALPKAQAFVYYLILSPTTVKIGTTRNLPQRIATHGSELQYVIALELGGRDVEKARHDQFPMERHGVKEVFTISDALREHIESLVPQRDELMRMACNTPI